MITSIPPSWPSFSRFALTVWRRMTRISLQYCLFASNALTAIRLRAYCKKLVCSTSPPPISGLISSRFSSRANSSTIISIAN